MRGPAVRFPCPYVFWIEAALPSGETAARLCGEYPVLRGLIDTLDAHRRLDQVARLASHY